MSEIHRNCFKTSKHTMIMLQTKIREAIRRRSPLICELLNAGEEVQETILESCVHPASHLTSELRFKIKCSIQPLSVEGHDSMRGVSDEQSVTKIPWLCAYRHQRAHGILAILLNQVRHQLNYILLSYIRSCLSASGIFRIIVEKNTGKFRLK
jgi:hypothetical protein